MARRQYRRRRQPLQPVEFDVEIPNRDERAADGTVVVTWVMETFTCRGEVSSLHVSELVHNSDVSVATPEGMTIIRNTFAAAFGDEAEYRRFLTVALPHIGDDVLMEILNGLIEDFADRPTVPSPSSSPAPTTTGDDSKVVSLPGGYGVASTG